MKPMFPTALGRRTLHDDLNGAIWTRQRTVADLDYDLARDYIDSTQHSDGVTTAQHQERVDTAAAHTARANAAAQDRLTWTQHVGQDHVDYAQALANASNTLATNVKQARILFAQQTAAAANTWESSTSTADEGYGNSAQTASATYRSDATAADTAYATGLTTADNTFREGRQGASSGFQVNLATDHATALTTAASHRLGTYRAQAATSEQEFLTGWQTALTTQQGELSTGESSFTTTTNSADVQYVSSSNGANTGFVTSTEAASKLYRTDLTTHRGTYNVARETAAATQAESEAFARGTYAVALADAHRVYDNAVAQSNVTYIASIMPARGQRYIEQDSSESVTAYDVALAAAELQRAIEVKAAKVARVTSIGNALIARETAYGDAEVTHATQVGNARITYINSSNTAEDTYDGSWQAADSNHQSSLGTANNAHALGLANANRGYVNDLGDADVSYSQNLTQPLVDQAGDLAAAVMGFQMGTVTARQGRYNSLILTDPSDPVRHGAWRTNALADWMNNLAPGFNSFQTGAAQADADLSHNLTVADANQSRNDADADVDYLTASQPHADAHRTGELAKSHTYDTDSTNAYQEWDVDLAEADRDLDVDRAEAQKARRIARATAMRDYQIALAQAETLDGSDNSTAIQAAEESYEVDLADAEMNYTIDLADSDQAWINKTALADKTETHAWAAATHSYDVGVAGLDRTYLIDQTDTDGDYENDLASADATRVNAASTANGQWNTDQTTAEATYRTADHSARALSLGNLNTAANLPFTNFHAQRATAEQSAWLTVETAFHTTATNVNTDTALYDDLVANQITGLANTTTTAQQTLVGSVAPARETRQTSDAGSWKLYDGQSATAEELYQQQVALANHTHQVAIAHAERDLAINEDQTAYDQAVAATNNQRDAALLTAARNYAIAELGAEGQRDITIHNAKTSYDATAGTAEVARTQSLTTAIRDAEIADATGYRDMLLGIADELNGFSESYASTQESGLANLATTDDTPWANLASAEAAAKKTFLVESNVAKSTYLEITTDGQHLFTTSLAEATHAQSNAQTQALVNRQNQQNVAEGDFLTEQHAIQQAGAALGVILVDNPTALDPGTTPAEAPLLETDVFAETTGNAENAAESQLEDTANGINSDGELFALNEEQGLRNVSNQPGDKLEGGWWELFDGSLADQLKDTLPKVGSLLSQYGKALAEAPWGPNEQKLAETYLWLIENGFPQALLNRLWLQYLQETGTAEKAVAGLESAILSWQHQLQLAKPKFVGVVKIYPPENSRGLTSLNSKDRAYYRELSAFRISNDPEHLKDKQNAPADLVISGFDFSDSQKLQRLFELVEDGARLQAEIEAIRASGEPSSLPWIFGGRTLPLTRDQSLKLQRLETQFKLLKQTFEIEFGEHEIWGLGRGRNVEYRRNIEGGKGLENAINAIYLRGISEGGLQNGPTLADVYLAFGAAQLGKSLAVGGAKLAVRGIAGLNTGVSRGITYMTQKIGGSVKNVNSAFLDAAIRNGGARGLIAQGAGGGTFQITVSSGLEAAAGAVKNVAIAIEGRLVAAGSIVANVVTAANGTITISATARAGLWFANNATGRAFSGSTEASAAGWDRIFGGNTPGGATVGQASTTNYKKTFFDAYPHLEGKVVVHHAIEQQVLKRYPGRFTSAEIHSLENLRGIPKSINPELHLSKVRKEWNRFYKNNRHATRQEILDEATRIDRLFGNRFSPSL